MRDRLKLRLTNGAFTVLLDSDTVNTAYCDYTKSSRSADCSPQDIIEFCRGVLEFYGVEEDAELT